MVAWGTCSFLMPRLRQFYFLTVLGVSYSDPRVCNSKNVPAGEKGEEGRRRRLQFVDVSWHS